MNFFLNCFIFKFFLGTRFLFHCYPDRNKRRPTLSGWKCIIIVSLPLSGWFALLSRLNTTVKTTDTMSADYNNNLCQNAQTAGTSSPETSPRKWDHGGTPRIPKMASRLMCIPNTSLAYVLFYSNPGYGCCADLTQILPTKPEHISPRPNRELPLLCRLFFNFFFFVKLISIKINEYTFFRCTRAFSCLA